LRLSRTCPPSEHFLGGLFAAAVTPVALAMSGTWRRLKRRGDAAELLELTEAAFQEMVLA
jgi:hypothetical protein